MVILANFPPAPFFAFSGRHQFQIYFFRFENRLDDFNRPKIEMLVQQIRQKVEVDDTAEIPAIIENMKKISKNDLSEAVSETFRLHKKEMITRRSRKADETQQSLQNSKLYGHSVAYSKILRDAFQIVKTKKMRESNRLDVSRLSKNLSKIFLIPAILNSSKNQLLRSSEKSVLFKRLKKAERDTSSCKSSIRSKK